MRRSVRAVQGGSPGLGGHGKLDWARARIERLVRTRGWEPRPPGLREIQAGEKQKPKRQRKPPSARQPSRAELQTRIAELEGKLARAGRPEKLRFSVSAKGRVMVLGLGKFPVALYRGQWERLFGQVDELKAFITANASKLSSK